MKKIIMNRTIPDDHSFCVTTPNPTIVLFIAKSKQLMNLMQMNDLEAVLSLVEELVSYSKMVTPAFDIWDREALFAYTVCWELSFILLKLKTKKILVNQLNFRGVYGLFKQIYSGHQSPCTNKLNCLILMQLLPIFMENYLIRAANVCIQLIKAMKIEMEINNACTLTEETPYFSNTQEVEVQITFMVQVFAFSKKVLDDPGLEYDVRVGDNIFNDLLLEIGVEDYFKMPCIVRNKEVRFQETFYVHVADLSHQFEYFRRLKIFSI